MKSKIEKYGIRIHEYSQEINIYNEEACPVCLVNFNATTVIEDPE
jgi:hypothetical protein